MSTTANGLTEWEQRQVDQHVAEVARLVERVRESSWRPLWERTQLRGELDATRARLRVLLGAQANT